MRKVQDNNEAYIPIKDTGVEIPRDTLAGVTGWKTTAGLGLGLSIAKDIVKMRGGGIEVLSEGENIGTEVIIRLPRL